MHPEKIGRYQIISELGRGGMATVYHAHDPNFDREVALKVLPREFLHDPTFRERFEREAHTIARLEHQAIVPVYDYGEDNSQLYLVMRYMSGGSLEDRIRSGPLTLPAASRIMREVGAALDEAHGYGIIHRDLKPGNILFDRNGSAYLSDFGIAKLAEAGGSLTGTGIIGTPAYMSPEQARGEKDLDGRSDIYALGVILFEMLTGEAPYESDTPMGVAVKHILDPVPDILTIKPDLPHEVDEVIRRAMAKDRDARYPTAVELGRAIGAVAAGEPVPEELRMPTSAPVEVRNEPYDDEPQTLHIEPQAPAAPVDWKTAAPHATGDVKPTRLKGRGEKKGKERTRRPLRGCLTFIGAITVIIILGVFLIVRLIPKPEFNAGRFPDLLLGLIDRVSSEAAGGGDEVTGAIVPVTFTEEIDELDLEVNVMSRVIEIGSLNDDSAMLTGGFTAAATQAPVATVAEMRGSRGVVTIGGGDITESAAEDLYAEVHLQVTDSLPVQVAVSSPISDLTLNLTDLQLTGLSVQGGAGIVWIELPEAGSFDVSLEFGVGNAIIKVPDGLNARLVFHGEASNLNIHNDRFEQIDDTTWQTTGYDEADERVLIEIRAGLGNVRIEQ